jgi:hypothetical protein
MTTMADGKWQMANGKWQMTETPMTTTRAIVEVVVTKEKTTTEGVERDSVARDWSLQIFP